MKKEPENLGERLIHFFQFGRDVERYEKSQGKLAKNKLTKEKMTVLIDDYYHYGNMPLSEKIQLFGSESSLKRWRVALSDVIDSIGHVFGYPYPNAEQMYLDARYARLMMDYYTSHLIKNNSRYEEIKTPQKFWEFQQNSFFQMANILKYNFQNVQEYLDPNTQQPKVKLEIEFSNQKEVEAILQTTKEYQDNVIQKLNEIISNVSINKNIMKALENELEIKEHELRVSQSYNTALYNGHKKQTEDVVEYLTDCDIDPEIINEVQNILANILPNAPKYQYPNVNHTDYSKPYTMLDDNLTPDNAELEYSRRKIKEESTSDNTDDTSLDVLR